MEAFLGKFARNFVAFRLVSRVKFAINSLWEPLGLPLKGNFGQIDRSPV
jgi:hypothetical protein